MGPRVQLIYRYTCTKDVQGRLRKQKYGPITDTDYGMTYVFRAITINGACKAICYGRKYEYVLSKHNCCWFHQAAINYADPLTAGYASHWLAFPQTTPHPVTKSAVDDRHSTSHKRDVVKVTHVVLEKRLGAEKQFSTCQFPTPPPPAPPSFSRLNEPFLPPKRCSIKCIFNCE